MSARASWSFPVAAVAATLTLALMPAAVPALAPGASAEVAEVDDDPDVQEAREKAEQAREEEERARRALDGDRAELDGLADDLDRAAEAYEHANAHHQRLLDERDGPRGRADAAAAASEEAREAFAEQVADLYRRGPVPLRLSPLVLASQSPSDALHRFGLLKRVSVGSLRRFDHAERVAGRTADDARQQEVVTVGTEGAAAALRRRGDELAAAVQVAEQRVSHARDSLSDAEAAVARADSEVEESMQAAQRRIEWQQRALAEAEALAKQGHRLPAVDGKVCPIGAPHGFGDSWLAPRPGGRQHRGVDMFAVHGMPLYAVTDGTVRVANNRLGGLVIHLHADSGDRYYYAHLSAVSVASGDRVAAGEVIGANGNSGNARTTPPHLHWQYHPGGGGAVNPYPLARALCR